MATIEELLAAQQQQEAERLIRNSFAINAGRGILANPVQQDPSSSLAENLLAPFVQQLVGQGLTSFGASRAQKDLTGFGNQLTQAAAGQDPVENLRVLAQQNPRFSTAASQLANQLQLQEQQRALEFQNAKPFEIKTRDALGNEVTQLVRQGPGGSLVPVELAGRPVVGTRFKPGVTVNMGDQGPSGKEIRALEIKTRSDLQALSKDLGIDKAVTRVRTAQEIVDDVGRASDITLVNLFAKSNDDAGRVTDQDFTISSDTQSLLDQAVGNFSKWFSGGAALQPEARKRILRLIQQSANSKIQTFNEGAERITLGAETQGANRANILVPGTQRTPFEVVEVGETQIRPTPGSGAPVTGGLTPEKEARLAELEAKAAQAGQ